MDLCEEKDVNSNGDEDHIEWVRDYFIFLRKTRYGKLAPDPFRAGGYLNEDGTLAGGMTRKQFDEATSQVSILSKSMLVFVLAHELGHFIDPRSASAPQERQVHDEIRADQFAVKLLADLETKHKGNLPFHLIGPMILFHGWVLSMDGRHHRGITHPLNHQRVIKAADAIESLADLRFLPENERKIFLKEIENTRKLGERLHPLDTFYAELEELADNITLEKLRQTACVLSIN